MQSIDAIATAAQEWNIPPGVGMFDSLLLNCRVILSRLQNKPVSADTLVASPPPVDSCLTPELFVLAACRVGYPAHLLKQSLEQVSEPGLPAVLLLRDKLACNLRRKKGGTAPRALAKSRRAFIRSGCVPDKSKPDGSVEPLATLRRVVATVDITTGKKTVLHNLLKPIIKTKEMVLRER